MSAHRTNKTGFIQKLGQMVKKTPAKGENSDRAALLGSFRWPSDRDDYECPSPPADVPKGYLAVYVGNERRRFVIPTGYLMRPVFRTLLQKAEEEFGFVHKGGLTIPCEVKSFKQVLSLIERNEYPVNKAVPHCVLNFNPKERECGKPEGALYSRKDFRLLFRSPLQKSFG